MRLSISATVLRTNFLALACLAIGASVQAREWSGDHFITLGTQGGPVSNPMRSQPANALMVGEDAYLVDVGDGTAQQLAKAGIGVERVRAVFLSHLHFDHTGGLGALLGLRLQLHAPGVLTVYGPPGTRELVAGLVASMAPAAEAGFGLAGQPFGKAGDAVIVFELSDRQQVMVGPLQVTTRQNTHYSFAPGSDLDRLFKSFSFRFDLAHRSIVYTGDTGASEAVTELARDADLLVSEMIDVDATMAAVRRNSTGGDPAQLESVARHLAHHHLTPEAVGELAARAKVKRLVVTHLGVGRDDARMRRNYIKAINRFYNGPVVLAVDLEEF